MDVLLCGEREKQQTVSHLSCCSEPRSLASPSFSLQGEEFALDQAGAISINEFPLQEDQQLPIIKSVPEKDLSGELEFTPVPSESIGGVGNLVGLAEAQQLPSAFKEVLLVPKRENLVDARVFASLREKPTMEQVERSLVEELASQGDKPFDEQKCVNQTIEQSFNPQVTVSSLDERLGPVPSMPVLQAGSDKGATEESNEPVTVLIVNANVIGAVGEIKFQRNMGGVKIVFPPTTAGKVVSFSDLINLFSLNEVRQAFCAESKEEDIIQQLVQQGLGSEGITNSGRASSLSHASSLDLPNSLLSPLSSVCDSWSWEISHLLSEDENSDQDEADNRSELNTPIVTLRPRPTDDCSFSNPIQYAPPLSDVPVNISIPNRFEISPINVSEGEALTVSGNFGIPTKSVANCEGLNVTERFGIAPGAVLAGKSLALSKSVNSVTVSEDFGLGSPSFQIPNTNFMPSSNTDINVPQRVFTPLQVQIPEESDSSARMSRTLHSCNTYFEELSLGISPVLDLDPNVATVRVSCPPTENSQHSLFRGGFGILPPIQNAEQEDGPSEPEPASCNTDCEETMKDNDSDIKEVSVDIIIDDGKMNWLKLLPDPTDEFIKKISHKCYKCHICLKSFRFKFQVQRHIKTSHSTEKPFICAICGATFSVKYYLTRHMKLHDSNNKFECKSCNRKFTRRYQLIEHEQSHIVPSTLKCTNCGKQFHSKSAFNVHKSICPTNLQPYICDICGKTYPGITALNHHRVRHELLKKFKCTMCDSSFHTQWQLVKHTKRHASQGLYVCKFCSLAFDTTTNLKKHMVKCPALTVNKIAKENSTEKD